MMVPPQVTSLETADHCQTLRRAHETNHLHPVRTDEDDSRDLLRYKVVFLELVIVMFLVPKSPFL